MRDSDPLRQTLLQTDDTFRQLAEQHEELDVRLRELSRQTFRTGSEERERITLKKRKLQLKDRMEDMLRRHRELASGGGSPALQTQPRG